jgi:hypothetical protein
MDILVKERRKAQRLPMNDYIKYKVIRRGTEAVEQDQFTRARGHDISEFGISMITYEKFNPGDIVRVDFMLNGKEVRAVCEVVWSGHVFAGEDMYQYSAGLEFACLTEDERCFLRSYFTQQFESVWNFLLNPEV